jgi:C4-dicarboxylate-specific signal transduction histidine kinase
VRAFTPLLRSLAGSDATISMAVAPGLPELPFAAEVLERILVNLTRNAVAALRSHHPSDASGNPLDRTIHIGVCGDATHLSLTVMDNGPGMPTAIAAAFLKPAPLPQGAIRGLGHRVIGDLIQSTGGHLSITVVPKRGTTMQIDWPITGGKTSGTRSDVATSPSTGANSGQIPERLSNLSAGQHHQGGERSCSAPR